jgi:hypothetical protein
MIMIIIIIIIITIIVIRWRRIVNYFDEQIICNNM